RLPVRRVLIWCRPGLQIRKFPLAGDNAGQSAPILRGKTALGLFWLCTGRHAVTATWLRYGYAQRPPHREQQPAPRSCLTTVAGTCTNVQVPSVVRPARTPGTHHPRRKGQLEVGGILS